MSDRVVRVNLSARIDGYVAGMKAASIKRSRFWRSMNWVVPLPILYRVEVLVNGVRKRVVRRWAWLYRESVHRIGG